MLAKWFKSWFKPVTPKPEYEIKVNGRGEFFVHRYARHVTTADIFKGLAYLGPYGNIEQCENAILELKKKKEELKTKHVKYV